MLKTFTAAPIVVSRSVRLPPKIYTCIIFMIFTLLIVNHLIYNLKLVPSRNKSLNRLPRFPLVFPFYAFHHYLSLHSHPHETILTVENALWTCIWDEIDDETYQLFALSPQLLPSYIRKIFTKFFLERKKVVVRIILI